MNSFSNVDFPLPLRPHNAHNLILRNFRRNIIQNDLLSVRERNMLRSRSCKAVVRAAGHPSSTAGVSSKMSSTRLPAAKVFLQGAAQVCQSYHRAEGLISAMLGIRTPSNPTACRWYSMAETKSMARSSTENHGVGACCIVSGGAFHPLFVFGKRFGAAVHFRQTRLPLAVLLNLRQSPRLSSTKLLRLPDLVRNLIPSSPLSREGDGGAPPHRLPGKRSKPAGPDSNGTDS